MEQFQYLNAVRRVMDHLGSTQAPAIDAAADLVCEALTNKQAVFCADIGHGIQGDFVNRAGGLAAVRAFSYGFTLNDAVAECLKDRPRRVPVERDLETVRLAVRCSNLRAGDVMLIGSVSGRNRVPVELALACNEMGVRVVGLTSMEYTRAVESLHPSGRKLCDVSDVVIDIGAPFGDAAVEIPGLEVPVLPVSGVAFALCGWMLWERTMQKMIAVGKPPTVFMSVNRPGGEDHYKRSLQRYDEVGY
ncbi:MAG: sugar isomerase domain-containing protein [Chthonomonadales bacterium]